MLAKLKRPQRGTVDKAEALGVTLSRGGRCAAVAADSGGVRFAGDDIVRAGMARKVS
jgi:hypothetical protein